MKKIIILIIFVLLMIQIVNALNQELFIPVIGDEELYINMINDEEIGSYFKGYIQELEETIPSGGGGIEKVISEEIAINETIEPSDPVIIKQHILWILLFVLGFFIIKQINKWRLGL